jgi:hypothetical protein
MLEGSPALMWTMQENVLVEGYSALNHLTKGRAGHNLQRGGDISDLTPSYIS